jgi:hypothetical protein
MATTDEIARLILEAEAKGFDEAREGVGALQEQLDKLRESYDGGGTRIDAYIEKSRSLKTQLDSLRSGLQAADEAQAKYGSSRAAAAALAESSNPATVRGTDGSAGSDVGRAARGGSGEAMGQLVAGLEALARALGGGGSAGVAGAAQLTTAAFAALQPRLRELLGAPGGEAGVAPRRRESPDDVVDGESPRRDGPTRGSVGGATVPGSVSTTTPNAMPSTTTAGGRDAAGAIDPILGQVETTQHAVADTQGAVAALAERVRRLEANNARLQSNAADLARRTAERQPTALNYGGPM